MYTHPYMNICVSSWDWPFYIAHTQTNSGGIATDLDWYTAKGVFVLVCHEVKDKLRQCVAFSVAGVIDCISPNLLVVPAPLKPQFRKNWWCRNTVADGIQSLTVMVSIYKYAHVHGSKKKQASALVSSEVCAISPSQEWHHHRNGTITGMAAGEFGTVAGDPL